MFWQFTRRKTDKPEDRSLVGRAHTLRRYVLDGAEWKITEVPCNCDRTAEERQNAASEVTRFFEEHRQ